MALLDRAIESHVEEADDLDWKQGLPHKEKREEFAKDVAAMANSGGGLIVYGVAEVPGPSSAAGAIAGVEGWGDSEERRLRQIAYSNIQPPVHGLAFHVAERQGDRVVALQVPSSPDSPHLVWSQDHFTAPIRYGAQTAFMRERDIERAYQSRWSARAAQETLLTDRASQLLDAVDLNSHVWMVAVAIPKQPRAAHLGRVSRESATEILLKLMQASPHLVQRGGSTVNVNPRAGLRRWRASGRSHGADDSIIAEIFDDGGVVFAAAGHPPQDVENRSHVHMMTVQNFVANALWLARLVSEQLHVDSTYDLLISVETRLPDPIMLRGFDNFGFLIDEDELAPIHRFVPVATTFEPRGSTHDTLTALREIATDVVNQGGIAHIGTTYITEPNSE